MPHIAARHTELDPRGFAGLRFREFPPHSSLAACAGASLRAMAAGYSERWADIVELVVSNLGLERASSKEEVLGRKLNIRCSQLARMLSVRRIERFAVPCAIFPLRVAFAPKGGHGVFGHGLQLIPDPCFLIPSPFLNEARRHQIQWALTGSR